MERDVKPTGINTKERVLRLLCKCGHTFEQGFSQTFSLPDGGARCPRCKAFTNFWSEDIRAWAEKARAVGE